MYNDVILACNSLLYILTFLVYQKWKKKFDIGSFVLLFYAIISLVAISVFYMGNIVWVFKDMKVFPFIYLYIALMVTFIPLLVFSDKKAVDIIYPDLKLMNVLSVCIIVVYAIFFVQTLSQSFSISTLLDSAMLADNYTNKTQSVGFDDGKINTFGVLKNIFGELLWLVLMYNWIKGNKYLSLGLLFALLVSIVTGLAWGARGSLIKILMEIPFVYLVFRNSMTPAMKKMFISSVSAVSVTALLGFIGLTVGRFGDSSRFSIWEITEYYLGSNFLFFNNYALDAGGLRYGDRVFPLVRSIFDMDITGNYVNRRLKYHNMALDDSQFSFFVGEFTLDFGMIGAMVLLIFISFVFYKLIRSKSQYKFGQILLLSVLFRICVCGFTLFPYSELSGNIALLYVFFFYFVFDKIEMKNVLSSRLGN